MVCRLELTLTMKGNPYKRKVEKSVAVKQRLQNLSCAKSKLQTYCMLFNNKINYFCGM